MDTPPVSRRARRSFPAQSAGSLVAAAPADGTGTPRTAKRRIVRRKPWQQRLRDLPDDLILKIQLQLDRLEFASLAFPTGLALNGVHAFIKLMQFGFSPGQPVASKGWSFNGRTLDATARLQELQQQQKPGSRIGSIVTLLSLSFVLWSCLNTAHLFLARRPYRLHLRKDPVNSPNAHFVDADMSLETPSLWTMIKRRVFGFPSEGKSERVLQVDIWTPPEMSLGFFAAYSPPVALAWHFINSIGWLFGPLLILLLTAQTNLLIYAYTHLVKDRALISAEVLNEYNEGFVFPRVFPNRRDVGTNTNEAEMFHLAESYEKARRAARRQARMGY